MYDDDTLRFIRGARKLPDLDLEGLPQRLTAAYADIISARLRLSEAEREQEREDWKRFDDEFSRLANTYEILTIVLREDSPERASTAFVAASAHHARSRAAEVLNPGSEPLPFDRWSLPPKTSAALLYVIGGHLADAAELGRELVAPDGATSMFAETTKRVGMLVSGTGNRFLELSRLGAPPLSPGLDTESQAVEHLLLRLIAGIQAATHQILGDAIEQSFEDHFDWVLEMTSPESGSEAWSAFLAPGVRHLALLLRLACKHLNGSSVASIPPPPDSSIDGWQRFIRFYSENRPLLWKNHRSAIANELLHPGGSAVISFPTGAGKSALAELRCAAEYFRGRRVIYLVPTRALVAQVRRQLADIFKYFQGIGIQGFLGEDSPGTLEYDIAVMTPESCLVMIGAEPQVAENVGLVVFDECHLLSGAENTTSLPDRRAIDANLALLELQQRNPAADIMLLSAMISNAEELAKWIGRITERDCIAYTDAWKPTRQVRGVLAYPFGEISALRRNIKRDKQKLSKGQLQKTADATPWGVFCHKQVWSTDTSFHSIQMLSDKIRLGLNKFRTLTANRNNVAAHLTAAFIRAGIRPLVFIQNITHMGSAARETVKSLSGFDTRPVEMDRELLLLAALELGEPQATIEAASGIVGIHHSLLLPTEREAMEKAYKSGLYALFATPTLAQGMNLPAEIVIIAGDNRWEDEEDGESEEGEGSSVILPVHEILNAAGRAGRAGMFAQGLVFLIPSEVLTIEKQKNTILFEGLDHAVSLLGSPDQCLRVCDPLQQVMDRATKGGDLPEVCQYFLRKFRHEGDVEHSASKEKLLSSLGYHQAMESGSGPAYEALVDSTFKAAEVFEPTEDTLDGRIVDLARTLGVSAAGLKQVSEALPGIQEDYTVDGWIEWLVSYIRSSPDHLAVLLHLPASGLHRIVQKDKPGRPKARSLRTAGCLAGCLPLWTSGAPLSEIDALLFASSGRTQAAKDLRLARRFHNETAPSLGGLGYLLRRLVLLSADPDDAIPLALEALPGCLSGGYNRPELLALHRVISRQRLTCRRDVWSQFEVVERHLRGAVDQSMKGLTRDVARLAKQLGVIN